MKATELFEHDPKFEKDVLHAVRSLQPKDENEAEEGSQYKETTSESSTDSDSDNGGSGLVCEMSVWLV